MSALSPSPWEIIEDDDGYSNIHHPREEGQLGDIVCTVFQDEDHARLIAAAPELLQAAQVMLAEREYERTHGIKITPKTNGEVEAHAAIAKALGL